MMIKAMIMDKTHNLNTYISTPFSIIFVFTFLFAFLY